MLWRSACTHCIASSVAVSKGALHLQIGHAPQRGLAPPLGDLSAIAAEVEKLLGEKAMMGMHGPGMRSFAPPPPPPTTPSPHSALSSLLSSAKALQSTMPGVDIMHLVQTALAQQVSAREAMHECVDSQHMRAGAPQRRQSYHSGTPFLPPPHMCQSSSMQVRAAALAALIGRL